MVLLFLLGQREEVIRRVELQIAAVVAVHFPDRGLAQTLVVQKSCPSPTNSRMYSSVRSLLSVPVAGSEVALRAERSALSHP